MARPGPRRSGSPPASVLCTRSMPSSDRPHRHHRSFPYGGRRPFLILLASDVHHWPGGRETFAWCRGRGGSTAWYSRTLNIVFRRSFATQSLIVITLKANILLLCKK